MAIQQGAVQLGFKIVAVGLLAASMIWLGRSGDDSLALANDPPTKTVPAPEFARITDWLNTKPLKIADLKGKVVILHFWTNGCINCIHNYPHYREWSTRYAKNDKVFQIGVHTPEFDSEKNVDRIKSQMTKNKLTFAVAVDNEQATWKAWNNRYWPAVYLIDAKGNVRDWHEGELGEEGFKRMTKSIEQLLAEVAK